MLGLGLGVWASSFYRGRAVPSGPFKVALWGQSEDYYILSAFHDTLAPEPLVADGLVTFWWHDRTNSGAAGVQSVTLAADTVANDSRVTAGMVAMGNTFMRRMPGREVCLIMHVDPGTDPREIMDDAHVPVGKTLSDKRHWADDAALHAAATADGVAVAYGWHSWFAAPGSYAEDYGKGFAAFLWGRDLSGDLLTYSEASPLSLTIGGNDWSVSHTLKDLYGESFQFIGMSGAHRFVPAVEPDLENAATYVGGASQAGFVNKQKSTISWRDLMGSAAFSGRVIDAGFHLNAHSIGFSDGAGSWSDGAHPSGTTDEGINYRARQTAYAIMKGAGITSFAAPTIDNAEWQPDGSYMEFWSSAGAITTLRIEAGDPALPATYDHWTEVSGVQVDGFPAHQADIVAGRVRIYPISGTFTNLSAVTFGEGGASGQLLFPEDLINELYRDWPIIDLGLSDVPGLPLAHLPSDEVMASTVEGEPTFDTASTGPYFADTATVGADQGAFTMMSEGAFDFAPMSGSCTVFGISGQGMQVQLLTGAGALRVNLRDSTGTFLLSNELSASGIISDGVLHKIVASMDLDAQVFRMWVDDALVMDKALAANTGKVLSARQFVFARADNNSADYIQAIGTWTRFAAWKEYTSDGSLPVSTPYGEVVGPAAVANAHPWKLGSDAA